MSEFITQDGTRPNAERDAPTVASPPLAPRLDSADDVVAFLRDEAPPYTSAAPYLQVLGGKAFDLVNPRATDVNFHHMATVLSRIARFAGHTERGSYTVAQHSVEGAGAILRDTGNRLAAAAFLLHDGHEYITTDLPTPIMDALRAHATIITGSPHAGDIIKQSMASLKHRIDAAIYEAAGLPWPLSPEVRKIVAEYDLRMLQTERKARLAPFTRSWGEYIENAEPVQGCDLFEFQAGTIASFFAQSCRDLLPALGGTIDD